MPGLILLFSFPSSCGMHAPTVLVTAPLRSDLSQCPLFHFVGFCWDLFAVLRGLDGQWLFFFHSSLQQQHM